MTAAFLDFLGWGGLTAPEQAAGANPPAAADGEMDRVR